MEERTKSDKMDLEHLAEAIPLETTNNLPYLRISPGEKRKRGIRIGVYGGIGMALATGAAIAYYLYDKWSNFYVPGLPWPQ